MNDNWKSAWQPLIDWIEQEDQELDVSWGADPIEQGAVRRYLEPLEFDCPLHYDREVARAQGYEDIIAPYTSLLSFSLPALWSAGESLFTVAERNAQPDSRSLRPPLPAQAPAFAGYFATDMDFEFIRPALVGETLGKRGPRIVSCVAKETRVGRGAFIALEYDIITVEAEVIALLRTGLFCYNPITASEAS